MIAYYVGHRIRNASITPFLGGPTKLSCLIYNIIHRFSTKVVQIMHLCQIPLRSGRKKLILRALYGGKRSFVLAIIIRLNANLMSDTALPKYYRQNTSAAILLSQYHLHTVSTLSNQQLNNIYN